jgi:hypothetical protein
VCRYRRTLFRFPSSRAYSSRTSCSSGESVSLSRSAPDVCEAERCASCGSDAMAARKFGSWDRARLRARAVCVEVSESVVAGC